MEIYYWKIFPNLQELPSLKGHSKPINSIDVSKDWSLFLTSSMDQTFRVWDANTCEEIWTHSISYDPRGYSYFRDSTNLEIIYKGSREQWYNIEFGFSGPYKGFENEGNMKAISPCGKLMLSETFDEMLHLIDLDTGDHYSPPSKSWTEVSK